MVVRAYVVAVVVVRVVGTWWFVALVRGAGGACARCARAGCPKHCICKRWKLNYSSRCGKCNYNPPFPQWPLHTQLRTSWRRAGRRLGGGGTRAELLLEVRSVGPRRAGGR